MEKDWIYLGLIWDDVDKTYYRYDEWKKLINERRKEEDNDFTTEDDKPISLSS
tara:strand:+ start:1785 stop:1943 length:159 start_codon:yes stop_codon:yes gene_type:complete